MERSAAPILLALLVVLSQPVTLGGDIVDLNTSLMRSTFMLKGDGNIGTCFILIRPKPGAQGGHYVLVTSAHVLEHMKGEEAVIVLRKAEGQTFKRRESPVRIRRGAKPLWTRHPEADVAVMLVPLPRDADLSLVSTDLLATDAILELFEVHPGDRLSCLGFPYGLEASEAGFPILRSGQIASYPLTPTRITKTMLFDFNVFPGNSGGPVYLVDSQRYYGGGFHAAETVRFIAGLVSERIDTKTDSLKGDHGPQLGLGVVVHASMIREAIDLLPPVPEAKSDHVVPP